jgi:serine/threonine protein kinase/predicted ATPase
MSFTDAGDWNECEAIIKRFEQAWRDGQRPELATFLDTDAPKSSLLLLELIHIDLEFRLKAGDDVRVEKYLSQFPELSRHRSATMGLIAAEYKLRNRIAGEVELDEYRQRFPEHADELPRRLARGEGDTLLPSGGMFAAAPPVWPTVPGYEIIEQLGRGGMGVVYKATDANLGRHVALKFLPAEFTHDADRLERFRREARTASALNHPHICTVHALDEHLGHPFIVMEHIDGLTLNALMKRRLDLDEWVRIIGQAAHALAAAHDAGVVHRDVKPENIMARADGYVKVLDFGLARRLPSIARPAPGDTDPGTLLGTVAYMSPEQARGQAADTASDVFSLGVVLYELVTGKHPFEAHTAIGMLQAISSGRPTTPSRLNPEIPAALDGLIEGMLNKDAPLRPTAAEVAAALAAGVRRSPPATPSRPQVRRDPELALLRAALERADSGRGSILCVAGEPGIGKTTLVDGFLAELLVPDARFQIARGQCSERLADTEAYLPVIDALGDWLRGGAGGAVTRLMKAVAPTWYTQVAPTATAEAARASSQPAMLREFCTFLQEVTRLGAVVLFIDDVHWADVSTTDLLAHVGRQCPSLRVLLIVTYRPTELLLGPHPFHGVKQELQSKQACTELSLGFLSRADVERYLSLAFPDHAFPADFARIIHARTEGSPLFMVDLLRYLREREVIALSGEQWSLARKLPDLRHELPASVRSMIERKLERLSDEQRRLLSAACVQGVEFDSAVIAGALQLDAVEVEERLQVLGRVHGLVRLVRESEFPDRTLTLRYAFIHGMYQEVLEADLPPTRRAALGAALAHALEAHYGAAHPEVAAQLAYLYEIGRDFGRAAKHCSRAAQNAAQVCAHREAVQLAHRGLRLLEALPESRERDERELALQTMLGLQLQVTQGYAAPNAEPAYRRARELCERHPENAPLFPVLWGLWLAAKVRSELPKARVLADELHALARQLNHPDYALQAQQALAVTTLCLGEPAATLQHSEQATVMYNADRHRTHSFVFGQDPGVACKAFGAIALWLLGHPDAAVQLSADAIRLSHELGEPSSQALALHFAAMVYQLRRDSTQTLACAEACSAFAAAHGLSFWMAGSAIMSGWAMVANGDADTGLARLRKGLRDWQATGSGTYQTYYLGILARVLAERGEQAESAHLLDKALAMVSQTAEAFYEPELLRLRGELLLDESPELARERFHAAFDLAGQQGSRSLQLRAARSLFLLEQRRGHDEGARARLVEVSHSFTSGFETADLREARASLAAG